MRDITADEIRFWDQHNDERNDARYRKTEDCNDLMGKSDARLDKMQDALTECRVSLRILIGILSAIGAAVLPVCIKILFGGAA